MGRPKKIKETDVENIDQAEIAEHEDIVAQQEPVEPVKPKRKTISREDEIRNALAGLPVNVTFDGRDGTMHIAKGARVESLRMDWDIGLIVKTAQRICM